MGFISKLLKEKHKALTLWTKEHDDAHTWSDWFSLISRFLIEGMWKQPGDFMDGLAKVGGAAWSAYESTERLYRCDFGTGVVAVTENGKLWGFGDTVDLAIEDFVRQADKRWGEDEYRTEVYSTKVAKVVDYVHFDRMFEDAVDTYRKWHDEGDADPIWANGGTSEPGELEQLIGEVIEGYHEARGGKWSHPHIPTGKPIKTMAIKVEDGMWQKESWRWTAIPQNIKDES